MTVYGVAICGAGPAGIGLLFAAYKSGQLDALIKRKLVVIDKQEKMGAGLLKDYKLTANTTAGTFLEVLDCDPHGIFQGFSENENEVIESLRLQPSVPHSLKMIGDFLEAVTKKLLAYVQLQGAIILNRTEVIQVNKQSAFNEIDLIDLSRGERIAVCAREVVLNLGGQQSSSNYLQSIYSSLKIKPKSQLSSKLLLPDQILRMDDEKVRSIKSSNKSILIIGSSHSAFSVIERLANIASDTSESCLIDVLYKGKIRIFYPSIDEAMSDRYKFDHDLDVCPLTKGVNRYGGLRFSAKEIARKVNDKKNMVYNSVNVGFHQLSNLDESDKNELVDTATIVVPCFGYMAQTVKVFDEQGIRVVLAQDGLGLKVDEFGRLYNENREVIDGLYSFGLGSGLKVSKEVGGESSFFRRVDGVWLYQNDIGMRVLNSILK